MKIWPNIIEITDFEAPELDVYARYSEVQLRGSMNRNRGFLSQKVQR